MTIREVSACAAVTGVVLVLAGCAKDPYPSPGAFRPECPTHDTILRISLDRRSEVVLGGQELATVGPKTDVVEFHDCQRFVERAGPTLRYGPLVAIFASDTLGRGDFPSGQVISIALIYNYDGRYDPLHIERGFNCLYAVAEGSNVMAWMRPVGDNEDSCQETFEWGAMPPDAVPLHVALDTLGRYHPEDIPPVARWDYDADNDQQYIGIGCAPLGWCSIYGLPALSPSRGYEDVTVPAREARVFAIKGWYDHQRLGSARRGKATTLTERWGNIFPAPDLGSYNDAAVDFATWRFVATVQLDAPDPDYRDRFNIRGAGLGLPHVVPPTRIHLCSGSRSDCSVPDDDPSCATPTTWWAMITTPNDTAYRCVTRRGHEGKSRLVGSIPATVRWRWKSQDETAWVRCGYGCCTIE